MVVKTDALSIDGNSIANWWDFTYAKDQLGANGHYENFIGPFRVASLNMVPGEPSGDYGNKRDIISWEPRDTMAAWSDGTSNQLLFGEKHIPAWALMDEEADAQSWHGSYLKVSEKRTANLGRFVSNNAALFARSPNDPITNDVRSNVDNQTAGGHVRTSRCALGSSHPGIVNFLVGDGSVRAMGITTEPSLVRYLTQTNDGHTANGP